jgi:hypothetical protein
MKIGEKRVSTQSLGRLRKEIRTLLPIYPTESTIKLYPSVIKHIKKRHPYAYREYFNKIREILEQPDYIGMREDDCLRIELVKCYKDMVLLALKIDEEKQLFVCSLYIIEPNRVDIRVKYGRLLPVHFEKTSKKTKQRYNNNMKK